MPAGLYESDSMFSVREVPWHQLGVVLEKPPATIAEALELSGLDWDIVQVPTHVTNPVTGEVETDRLVNYRSDTGDKLGSVTEDYRVLTNREAFSFLANIFGTDMLFETAGSLHNGRIVFVTMRLPEWVEVGGDTTGMYGFITNCHAGYQAIRVKNTAVRVVCQNTHGAALKDGKPVMPIPHLGDPLAKMHQAREVLGVQINYLKQFKQLGDQLALVPFTVEKLDTVVKALWPTEGSKAGKPLTKRMVDNAVGKQDHVKWMFREAPTCTDHANAPGTAWTALNACTEFIDYGVKDDDKSLNLMRIVEDKTSLKAKATDMIAEMALA